ncbi:3318_t:CDS:2 [Diversispora eburnea]|uniref:3318_t:CDS:1 n=1 Tax=Diversispora eburnea TaxID=1213867 RepID=A0A9N8VYX7_9GLOM|nr:3318_t:CDS:2 [Diversispora eburnea]
MTAYCCLRDTESSGYPSRSHIANTLLQVQEFNGTCKKWIDKLTNENSQVNFWESVKVKMSNIVHPQHFFQYGRPLWGALLPPSSETEGFKPEPSYIQLCLNISEDPLKKGIVEAGYRGELTARLLLLKAWDDCIQNLQHSTVVGNMYSPNVGIEKLPHMPFLSLYLQLGATKDSVDILTASVKETQQFTKCKDQIKNFEIIAYRKHFKISFALFGLSSKIYSCLKQHKSGFATSSPSKDLTSSFEQLLTAWVDPTVDDKPEKVKIIKRMEPLVYKME